MAKDKRKNKEGPPVASMFENAGRMFRGNVGDQYHRGSWKSTLIIIIILIVGYFIYVTASLYDTNTCY